MLSLRLLVFNWFLGCAEVIMAVQGGACVVSGSPFRYSSSVLALSHFGLPHLICFPFRPYPPPPPPLPHLLIPWSSLPVRVPGEAGESVREGGGAGWKLRNVSPFDLKGGGVSWFNYLLSSLGNPIKTFWGAKFNMCVGGGGEKGGGGQMQIFAGFLC